MYSEDRFDLYRFRAPEIVHKRYFLLMAFYTFDKSFEKAEYYVFSDKDDKILKKEGLLIEGIHHNEILCKNGFEQFVLEKAIDGMKSLFELNPGEIKELCLEKIDIENYNIFIHSNCKVVIKEIIDLTKSDILSIALQKILNLKYIIEISALNKSNHL
jgi:hypothetical protein